MAKITVDDYLKKHEKWHDLLSRLRALCLDTELEETIKWGAPVYTLNGKNVVGLGAFKAHAGLWFFQGGFLRDEGQQLVNAQEGKTKALRQWRFTEGEPVNEDLVRSYIVEAIENQAAGKMIKPNTKKPLVIPAELQAALTADAQLAEQFAGFSKGKQREFADYISEAKRDATKQKRLEKIIPMIMSGIGLNDKYRNC